MPGCFRACFVLLALQAAKRLDMVQWGAAYQSFALGAAAVGMWEYHLAMAHHTNCFNIACKLAFAAHQFAEVVVALVCLVSHAGQANSLGKRHQLAQIYDECCRKEWAERSFRGTATCVWQF